MYKRYRQNSDLHNTTVICVLRLYNMCAVFDHFLRFPIKHCPKITATALQCHCNFFKTVLKIKIKWLSGPEWLKKSQLRYLLFFLFTPARIRTLLVLSGRPGISAFRTMRRLKNTDKNTKKLDPVFRS